MTNKGFVYVMSNISMPGLIKVGMSTRSPEERARELSSDTGVPTPYLVEYYAIFDDMRIAEKEAHKVLHQYHHNKEFFKITVPEAIHLIENLEIPFTKHYSKPDNDIKAKRIKERETINKQQEYVSRELRRGIELRKKKQEYLDRNKLEEERKTQNKKKLKVGVNLFLLFLWGMGSILLTLDVSDGSTSFVNNLFMVSITVGFGVSMLYGILKIFTPLYNKY